MDSAALARYVGGALLAAPPLALLLLLPGLIWQGKAVAPRLIPAALATAFFLALALHPFPDPAGFDCRVSPAPKLHPFSFVTSLISHSRRGIEWHVWFGDLTAIAAVMNLLICGLIGLGLGAARCRAAAVMLFALSLPLVVEITQLTGFFGIYGCAYRLFDIDDIILNFAGVALGYLIWRLIRRT